MNRTEEIASTLRARPEITELFKMILAEPRDKQDELIVKAQECFKKAR